MAGPLNIAKAVGNRIASRFTQRATSRSFNTQQLATIDEPHSSEFLTEVATEHFHAPSLTTSINETICSSNPPSIPNRRISLDSASIENLAKDKTTGDDSSANMLSLSESFSFDRFSDDTIACAKAPPSKPFKRASMDSGFCDSMASTLSALTMDASFASELGKMKESFVTVDEDAFCLDLEDSFLTTGDK
jgi:hypothetical protein